MNGNNNRIYLVLPPNIMRRTREIMATRFPEVELDAPDIHSEMFAFASDFGKGDIPALTVSAYPQIVLRAMGMAEEGRLAAPSPNLPPLRKEFADIGMAPPVSVMRAVAVVPGVLAASAALTHVLEDWKDLCSPDFPGPVGCPPEDTPLPYLVDEVMRKLAGKDAESLLGKLDTRNNPIDINKRIASGSLTAALIIPAFARTFRAESQEGSGRMVWPKSGALAIPLMACLAADASSAAHAVLEYLLSDEFQRAIVGDGVIAPVRPGVPGFEELENNNWSIYWAGWDLMLDVARSMVAADIRP